MTPLKRRGRRGASGPSGPDRREAKAAAVGFAPRAAWSGRDYAALAREGYAGNAVVHRCVRLIAEAAASAPLIPARDRAADRALAALLARPNPDQSGAELRETLFGHLQIAGDGYLELVEAGEARAIYALRPDRVRVLTGPDGLARGWEHRSGANVRVLARDLADGRSPVLHLKSFNPADDHYGAAPLVAAARAVDVHNAGGAWAKALLDNAARPSGALVVTASAGGDGRLTEAQYERLRAELEGLHAGAENAGRPMLLEGGLDWTPMSLTPADMDFIEARREAAREIALAFGVPPLMLGLPGDNTFSNYREANLAFWRHAVLPLARKAADALSAWLAPVLGAEAAVRVDEDALPVSAEARGERWARIAAADFLTDAEKRRLLGVELDMETGAEAGAEARP